MILKTDASHHDFVTLLGKAQKYCAVQERCKSDIKKKLAQWGAGGDQISEIIARLENENYISEQRYSTLFASSKVNQLKWGRFKIKVELQKKDIPDEIINQALQAIDSGKYSNNIIHLITTKEKQLKDDDPLIRKHKLAAFLTGKGYEADMIKAHINFDE